MCFCDVAKLLRVLISTVDADAADAIAENVPMIVCVLSEGVTVSRARVAHVDATFPRIIIACTAVCHHRDVRNSNEVCARIACTDISVMFCAPVSVRWNFL